MGYTVETRGGKTGPINSVSPTPRVGDGEPGGKRTLNDYGGGPSPWTSSTPTRHCNQ